MSHIYVVLSIGKQVITYKVVQKAEKRLFCVKEPIIGKPLIKAAFFH